MPSEFEPTNSVFALYDTTGFDAVKPNDELNIRRVAFITILRPYAAQLLANIYRAGKYDLAVFSMGTRSYVKQCVELL
jgi:hypothetical protein